jgi:hypothetical protein
MKFFLSTDFCGLTRIFFGTHRHIGHIEKEKKEKLCVLCAYVFQKKSVDKLSGLQVKFKRPIFCPKGPLSIGRHKTQMTAKFRHFEVK